MEDRLTIHDKMFLPAMTAADNALLILLNKMKLKGVNEGKLSISITITMGATDAIDPDTGEMINAMAPDISYKASYSIKDGDSFSGGSRDDGTVVFIRDNIPRKIKVNKDQQSMF